MRGEPVSRILSTPDRSPGLDDHSSANRVTTAVKLPTRASRALASLRAVSRCRDQPPREAPIWHCSGWGLPCRSGYPSRGGLLPHRFTFTTRSRRRTFGRRVEVSSLWRFPWGYPRRGLPGTLANGSPDFPRPQTCVPGRGHPALRAWLGYACAPPASIGKRRARSAARARSVSSNGPMAHGRKRRRKAGNSTSTGRSG